MTTSEVGEQRRQGIAYGVTAYAVWGGFPLYWTLLEPSSAVEILAHRIIWTAVLLAPLIALTRRRYSLAAVRSPRGLVMLAVAAVLISANWGLYIWAVNADRVVETALGYFITPLVSVLLGVALLAERPRSGQWLALGVGALAVLVLVVAYGTVPWVAVSLAGTFGVYGLLKKTAGLGTVETLAVETAILVLPAVGYLVWLGGDNTFGEVSGEHTALLVLTGPVSAIPLLAFGAAVRRLPLSVLGMLQYVEPALQFTLGVVVFAEPMPPPRLAGFALVWLALVMLTVESLRHRRRWAPALEPAH